MDTWMSWAIFIAILGAGYWYYSQNSHKGRQRGRTLQRTGGANTKAVDTKWIEDEVKAKPGTKVAKAKAQAQAPAPRKSVKKAVQEVGDKAESHLSTASSTAGADADDDMSPVASPNMGTSSSFQAPSGRNVSDMLEPKAATANVMSIKPSEKPARPSKPQPQRSETPQESKKQRQNRKKAEEAKAQREADEKERQVLLEKQRRTAREARGEAAKNVFQPSQGPASNPWTTVRSSGAVAPPATSGPLLDTFDPDVASTASSSEANTNGTAPTPDSTNYTNLPSEEEQLRMALEDSAWTTVAKGKKQRKAKAAGEEEGSDSGAPQKAVPVSAPTKQAPVKQAPVKQAENIPPTSRYSLLAQPTNATHPDDSDWPVV